MLTILMTTQMVWAQKFVVDKGNRLIAGNISFTSQGGELFESYPNVRSTTVHISTSGHQFIVPNVAIGLAFEFTQQDQGGSNTSTAYGIGPNLIYFWGNSSSKNFPYVGAGFRYTSMDTGNIFSGQGTVVNCGILATVNKNLGLVVEIGYHTIKLTGNNDRGEKSYSGNVFLVGIGIVGILY